MKTYINSLGWEVCFIDSPAKANNLDLQDDKEEFTLGMTRRSSLKILINKNMPTELVRRTIIHELTHAYFWSYGLNQYENLQEENVADFVEAYGTEIISKAKFIFQEFISENGGDDDQE